MERSYEFHSSSKTLHTSKTERRDLKEIFGQIFRMLGALTKTPIGLLPEGNTGGANVSPFKPMSISPENKAILEKIRNAQS